jgi:parallel beta-helix repeat protein
VATNGNDANSGSQSQPWKTLKKAASSVRAGDTVVVRAGRYAGFQKNLQGASGAPITLKASPGERVTLDANLTQSSADGCAVICLNTPSYLVFDGFEITDTHPDRDRLRQLDLAKPEDLAMVQAWLAVPENKRRESGSRGIRNAGSPAHHMIYQNLEIHDLFSNAFSGRHDSTQFIDNHVHHLGRPKSGYGWYLTGDQLVFRGNQVHHNTIGWHLYDGRKGGTATPLTNSIIENNSGYSNGQTVLFEGKIRENTGGLLISPGANNVIRNNLFFNNNGAGLRINSSGTVVLNNTFYKNKTGLDFYYNDGKQATIQNNIFFENGRAISGAGTNIKQSHNYTENPLFVDAAAGKFKLRPESPAINAGVSLPQVPCDFDGNKRPSESGYDIGAFEYGSSPMKPC